MENVDEVRMELFCSENKSIHQLQMLYCSIPKGQHTKQVFGLPTTMFSRTGKSWGWEWDGHSKEWTPVWTTQPIASNACMELVRCSCKSEKRCGTI